MSTRRSTPGPGLAAGVPARPLPACAVTAEPDPRWAARLPPPTAYLPKLTQPLVLDGHLDEWAGAAAVPVRAAAWIAHRRPTAVWQGPADAGLEVYCAWNDAGLCLAARVTDDDVINEREPARIYEQDCVEFFCDGRAGADLRRHPAGPGFYQVLVAPPTAARDVVVHLLQAPPAGVTVSAAGRRTATGYTLEVLVPWAFFPNLPVAPGARIGLQFALDDYDARHGAMNQPLMLTWRGAQSLFCSPQRLTRWTLCDTVPRAADTPLDLSLVLLAPGVHGAGAVVPVQVEVPGTFTAILGQATLEAVDWTGQPVWQQALTFSPAPAPWADAAVATASWPVGKVPDGNYTLTLKAADAAGAPLGRAVTPVALLRHVAADAQAQLATLAAARLDRLARSAPARALAYVGAGAANERLKRYLETGDAAAFRRTAAEVRARLEVLAGGVAPATDLLDLLNLAAIPEAQVAVEYPPANDGLGAEVRQAGIGFYWGSLPLAAAAVTEYPSAAAAAQCLAGGEPGLLLADPDEETAVAGLPARFTADSYAWQPLEPAGLEPQREAVFLLVTPRVGLAVTADLFHHLRPPAVVMLPGAPAALRAAAAALPVPVVAPAQAVAGTAALVVGDPRGVAALAPYLTKFWRLGREPRSAQLTVAQDRRVIRATAVSRAAAEQVMCLILAGQPVTPAASEALRQTVAAALPAAPAAPLPAGRQLWCGDVHLHSCYSDGQTTPVANLLETLYVNMDFAVFSDHETLDGALAARRQFERAGGLPGYIIVGQEIVTSQGHFNAYPLTAAIAPDLAIAALVKAVHDQGAVIQWNHPGSPPDAVAARTMATGLDAWEHYPAAFRRWQQEGRAPVVVGSTDSHTGSYERLERTIVLAPSPMGQDVAAAIRAGDALMVSLSYGPYLTGSDRLLGLVAAALRDGTALKQAHADRTKAVLGQVDLPKLIRHSPATVKLPTEL